MFKWAGYTCASCGHVVLARSAAGKDLVVEIIPSAKSAHEDIPEHARMFLQQAYGTLHAPDAAAMVAGSAVDAMLKHLGFASGSVYARIDEAQKAGMLTKGMADWAHTVRLGSNRPRHADSEQPHVTPEEAKRSVDFAEALGTFLFVMTAMVERGMQASA